MRNPFSRKKADPIKIQRGVGDMSMDDLIPDGEKVVAEAKHAKAKRRKNETMASVFQESVVETVMDELSGIPEMRVEGPSGTRYAAFLLKAADIGGLSKKTRRDEAKGAFVECVNSGRVKCLITPELLESEELAIVCDAQTLDAMGEFSMLENAPYEIVLVGPGGSIERTGRKASLSDAVDVLDGRTSIEALLGAADAAPDQTLLMDDPFGVHAEAADEGPRRPVDVDAVPLVDEQGGAVLEEVAPDEMPVVAQEPLDEPYDDSIPMLDEDLDDSEGDYNPDAVLAVSMELAEPEEVDPDRQEIDTKERFRRAEPEAGGGSEEYEVGAEEMEAAMVRRFSSDDLDLDVSLEPFQTQYGSVATYVPFETERGEGWLSEYLANMSRDANLELAQLHASNLAQMQAQYLTFMTEGAQAIERDLDITDKNTPFGKAAEEFREARDSVRGSSEAQVSRRRAAIDAEWQAELERVGAAAASRARDAYGERHGRAHQERLANVDAEVLDEAEDLYVSNMKDLRQRRRAEAAKQMDYLTTESLSEIGSMFEAGMAQEQALWESWRDAIREFTEANRADDIARTKVLEEDLRQTEKAETVMAEYKSQLEALSAEMEAKRKAQSEELERMRRSNKDALDAKDHELKLRVAEARAETERYQAQLEEANRKMLGIGDEKRAEYEKQLALVKSSYDNEVEHYGALVSSSKRNSVIGVALAVVAVVAALAIGILLGMRMSLDRVQSQVEQTTQQQVEQRLDAIDAELAQEQAPAQNQG